MTIGVDIRVLARGSRTGIEEYTLNLLECLLSLNHSVEWKFFYNAFRKKELDFSWLKIRNSRLFEFNIPNRFFFDPLAYFFNAPKIDKLLGGVDCFFSPHFLLTPLSNKCPRIITFHDLSFVFYPKFFPAYKRFWHYSMKPFSQANRASEIITVSESTKNDLVDLYGLEEKKVSVIYPGVKKHTVTEEDKERIRIKYGLPEKFVLFMGTIEPRKNLEGLIKAFGLLKQDKNFSEYKLVIAGVKGWLYEGIFHAKKESFFEEDILFPGFIDTDDKMALYSLADLFIYPSFFEGFGFPPLEAMACGTPTIVSNVSSLPEVVGDAALMVDPYDIEELSYAMKAILTDNVLRRVLIEKGLKRADFFSWEKCAKETLKALVGIAKNYK